MPPSGNGLAGLIGAIFGTPGFDGKGRLAYFSPVRLQFRGPPPSGGGGPPPTFQPPDSALVVRFDFATRTLDTAAVIKIQRSRTTVNRSDDGKMNITMTAFPPLAVDDWAVTSGGAIAVVRGRDYHIDRLNSDGSWSSLPRIPYEWERLDDSLKTALLDSTVTAMQANMDSMQARFARNQGAPGGPGNGPAAAERAGREAATSGAVVMTFTGPGGGERGGGGGPPSSINIQRPQVVRADLADVPDYRPPFRQGAVRADVEGNLWIRTNKVVDGRPVYDVVNGDGRLIDRVQLPAFRTIAGFGPGVVYLGVRDSTGVMHVEKARVK
jgi:hypothetical protein